ncbi:hypothetical protein D3C80_1438590 [compost metagenome]
MVRGQVYTLSRGQNIHALFIVDETFAKAVSLHGRFIVSDATKVRGHRFRKLPIRQAVLHVGGKSYTANGQHQRAKSQYALTLLRLSNRSLDKFHSCPRQCDSQYNGRYSDLNTRNIAFDDPCERQQRPVPEVQRIANQAEPHHSTTGQNGTV